MTTKNDDGEKQAVDCLPAEQCGTCKFQGTLVHAEREVKVCRRYPPRVLAGPQSAVTFFPMAADDSWCGEYRRGVGPVSPAKPEVPETVAVTPGGNVTAFPMKPR